MGLLEMIAGEDGIGWCGRLAMLHTSIRTEGREGFSLPVAQYLARRYGYTPEVDPAGLRERAAARIRILDEHLASRQARGEGYFGGARPSAIDVYAATFLTLLSVIDEAACPQLLPPLRAALGTAHAMLGDLVPGRLRDHRAMMFDRHLSWPIRLS
jgi:hypothetical protein